MLVLYGLLALASLSVRIANHGKARGMLHHQIHAWWRIFPVVSLALFIHPFGLIALACLIWWLALAELAPHHPGSRHRFWRFALAIVVANAIAYRWAWPIYPALLAGSLALQSLACLLRFGSTRLVWLLVTALTGSLLMLLAFEYLPLDARTRLAWLFYLFTLTALNDIGQFVAGKLFGRHRIVPRISPNKTWEGLLGGLLVSQLVSHLLGHYLALATPAFLTACGLMLSLGGFAGDLLFSAAKRYLSIKDFSQLIPGHGGILDRVDSLVVTAPLLYCLLNHFS